MTTIETHRSNDPETSKSRLPSPGSLFAVTLLVIVSSLCGWVGWEVHQRRATIQLMEQQYPIRRIRSGSRIS